MTTNARLFDDGVSQTMAAYAAALGALVGAVLQSDPGLIEDAAQHLDRHPGRPACHQAAQLLRDDLAAFTQDRTA